MELNGSCAHLALENAPSLPVKRLPASAFSLYLKNVTVTASFSSIQRVYMTTNYQRLIQLAEQTFHASEDSEQISMTAADRAQLARLHPACIRERRVGDEPVAWMLLFPTSTALMERFLAGMIGERSLLHDTPAGAMYEAVYICSALVLEEFRARGIARELACEALREIRATQPIDALFIWPFSAAGEALARSVARETGLPLRIRGKEISPPTRMEDE